MSSNQYPIGYVLWQGPSQIDGEPIVVVATLESSNEKTGNMVQTWIIRRDYAPLDAVAWGEDRSICGDCPHRGIEGAGRTCYVDLRNAPTQVYRSWLRGRYAFLPRDQYASAFGGRRVRMGAYGDPAAAPSWIWLELANVADGHTGYTHQWRRRSAAPLRRVLMASCDTLPDAQLATSRGWRTFRILPTLSVIGNEVLCPASDEAGKRTTCERCRLCAGTSRPARNVAIVAHGSPPKLAAYRRRFAS